MEVEDDGHCFYRAFGHLFGLEDDYGFDLAPIKLREAAASAIESDQKYDGFLSDDERAQVVADIRRGAWADVLSMTAVADLFNVQILVLTVDSVSDLKYGDGRRLPEPRIERIGSDSAPNYVLLGGHSNVHFFNLAGKDWTDEKQVRMRARRLPV